MSEDALAVAWGRYQERLGNLTQIEEARIERAFKSGWLQSVPPAPTVRIDPIGDGKWLLLLHVKLSPEAIAKIISGLEEVVADKLLAAIREGGSG